MLGTWQVTKVHIDTGKSRWNTSRDDNFNEKWGQKTIFSNINNNCSLTTFIQY
ncbi:MAG: hypothetical protein OEX07_13785 [Gammaproteobacteria bacterium]|nr:hypothetical protein [Gammaproteobacteria bacterium]